MCANFVLNEALKKSDYPTNAGGRIALARLRSEIDRRFAGGSPALSLEFFRNVVGGLAHLRGRANIDLRIDCLWSASHFLYLNGRTSEALLASTHLDRFLSQCSPLWQRKIH